MIYRSMRHKQSFNLSYLLILILASNIFLGSCSPRPMLPYSEETAPLVLLPLSQAGRHDERGRFRELFCAVLEKRGSSIPDYRPCEDALVRVGREPTGTGEAIALGPASRKLTALVVPGLGWDCFAEWLDMDDSIPDHLRQFGYDFEIITVDGLSSSTNNARQIRDAVMKIRPINGEPDLVLIGYSKGAPDILESLVFYPEIHQRIAAVVSIAGAIGGTPLANEASQSQLALLKHWPDARCEEGDGGAIESLRTSVRKSWLAENPIPY